MSFGQLAKFLLRKAKLLFPFFVVASAWAFQDRLSEIVTPRYCQVLAVYMVRGLDRITLPCDPDDVTLNRIKQHLPIFLPLLKSVEIFL